MIAGSSTRKPQNVTISLIQVPKDRARKEPGDIDGLAESMSEQGLLQPILVRPCGSAWELIAGHRRLEAARHLGWEEIFCVVALDLDDDYVGGLIQQVRTLTDQIRVLERFRDLQQRFPESWGPGDAAKQAGTSLEEVLAEVQEAS